MAAPAGGEKPGRSRRNGGYRWRCRDRRDRRALPPTIEHERARAEVDRRWCDDAVLLAVLQHVAQRIASLRRRRDDLVVIALGEHLAAAALELVQGASVKARARGVQTQDRACATPGPTAKQAPRPTRVVHVDGVRASTRERRERETRSVARRSRRLLRLRARLRFVDRGRAPFRSPLEAGAPELMLMGAFGRRRKNDVERHGFPARAEVGRSASKRGCSAS